MRGRLACLLPQPFAATVVQGDRTGRFNPSCCRIRTRSGELGVATRPWLLTLKRQNTLSGPSPSPRRPIVIDTVYLICNQSDTTHSQVARRCQSRRPFSLKKCPSCAVAKQMGNVLANHKRLPNPFALCLAYISLLKVCRLNDAMRVSILTTGHPLFSCRS
ncbi:hypothetical protein BKA63DRAFT_524982 [Paraphoma chrysanthemicola]|nr:hypothetical protein BKA63DRAFT_524982 [Paraphoma chrysanthemicola]